MKIQENSILAEAVIIMHKPTGFVIPQPSSRYGRGGSYVEPVDPKYENPRIFANELVAKAYLGQWVRGKVICKRYEDGEEINTLYPQSHRIKKDMEIVPVIMVRKESI